MQRKTNTKKSIPLRGKQKIMSEESANPRIDLEQAGQEDDSEAESEADSKSSGDDANATSSG